MASRILSPGRRVPSHKRYINAALACGARVRELVLASRRSTLVQEERQAASAMAPADTTPPQASPAKSPVSLHPAETSASGRSSEEQEAEVIEDDDDDDLDPLDIERIEADYRATRARAIFSAGAAARVVRLERMRLSSCAECHAWPLSACTMPLEVVTVDADD